MSLERALRGENIWGRKDKRRGGREPEAKPANSIVSAKTGHNTEN